MCLPYLHEYIYIIQNITFTGSNIHWRADITPSYIGHFDCDTVASTTLQSIYSVVEIIDCVTSPSLISESTIV